MKRKLAQALDKMYNNGMPDIIHGAKVNDFREVRAALEINKASIYQRDIRGLTALHIAAGKGNLSMVRELLLQDGINVYLKDDAGRDPLDAAISLGHKGIIDALFRFRAENPQEPSAQILPVRGPSKSGGPN